MPFLCVLDNNLFVFLYSNVQLLTTGFLHNDKQVTIKKGPSFCTTNYGQVADRNKANNPGWEQLTVYPIDLQFAMPNNRLDPLGDPADEENPDLLRIRQYDRFIVKFDGEHRMWYTLDEEDTIIVPRFESNSA